jgi:hypothetical protein
VEGLEQLDQICVGANRDLQSTDHKADVSCPEAADARQHPHHQDAYAELFDQTIRDEGLAVFR